jgi:hypothetical protein
MPSNDAMSGRCMAAIYHKRIWAVSIRRSDHNRAGNIQQRFALQIAQIVARIL